MKTIRLVFCIYCLLLIPFISFGKQYHFTRYSTDEGLSHNDITSIVQDNYGFIWFGTRDGLNRFDGKIIKTYKHVLNKENSYNVNFINAVCKDNKGNIWIASDGITRYNVLTDSLELMSLVTLSGKRIRNRILKIQTDSEGNVYFIEKSAGLYILQAKTNSLSYYSPEINQNHEFSPTALWVDGKDRIWIGSDKGSLYLFNKESGHFDEKTADCLKFSYDQVQHITGNGHYLYLGYQYSGVVRYDPEKETFSPIALTEAPPASGLFIHDILVDEHLLWIGTENGLYIHNEISKTTVHLQKNYFDPYALSDDAVYSIYKDNDKGIWIGTYFSGINYLSLRASDFMEKYYPLNNATSLSGSIVREICQDSTGRIWIGTEDAGLNSFNPGTDIFRHFSIENGLSSHNIHGLAAIGNKLYVGTYGSGTLDVVDLKTYAVSHFHISDDKNVKNSIYTICYDKRKRIWIGTRNGVYFFSPETKKFTRINELGDIFAHHIFEDSKGNTWIGTIGSGAICYQNDGKVIFFNEKMKTALGFNVLRVLNIFEDSKQRIWFSTAGNGLVHFNPDNNNMGFYSEINGFPNNVVYRSIEDESGNLWLGTNKGLIRLNPETNDIRVFTKNEGSPTNQFNYNAAFKDNAKKLYFGTVSGLIIISPDGLDEEERVPTVFFTDFRIDNKTVGIGSGSPLKNSILCTDEIVLKHNQNTVSFDFAILRYVSSSANSCYIKLEGLDNNWVFIDKELTASYSNLSPGHYILKIKVSTGLNKWTEAGQLKITILPPWWKSTGAYCSYAICIIGIFIYLYFRAKKNLEKKQKQLFLKMEREKERESYHAKMEFLTNIAHEIKTPLSLIKAPLELILKKDFDAETNSSLLTINKNTDRLLSLVYELLDFRKVESEGFSLNFQQTDISEQVRLTYDRFKIVAEQKKIQFELCLPELPLVAEVDPEQFTKIVSNLFNNALKYCFDFIKAELRVSDQNRFELVVENNGNPIPESMTEEIFKAFVQLSPHTNMNSGRGLGLPLARSLAELHGGQLYLNVSDSLNRFILSLPLRHGQVSEIQESNQVEPYIENDNLQTILIVEDNTEMCDFLCKRMVSRYNVLKAVDGLEAIQRMDGADVDLVVSDIAMPRMNGFDLLKTIKTNLEYSHIPVILLTAQSNLQSKIEGLSLGADAYIEKPFSVDYLQAQIENLLKSRSILKESFKKQPHAKSTTIALTKADELFLQQVNELIENNMTNPQLGVDLLADKLYMSRSSLHRKIKGISGQTPNDYIRLVQLKKAAQLLQEGNFRINEIAAMTGFTSSSYFAKSFRSYFGILPKEFG